jgi:phosphonoacetaldehyde hydrolase
MNQEAPRADRLQAVILDWAGTTIDFGCCAPAVAFVDTFARQGVALTVEQARGPMGTAKRRHIELLLELEPVAQRWRERHGRAPEPADVDQLYADFVPIQLSLLARFAELIPGTREAAAAFRRRGLRIGTTTGYSAEMMEVVREQARRQGFVPDAIVCPEEVPAGRPHPWMCLRAAMQLGVYPAASVVKIGDTGPDMGEGRNAGMWTIGVAATGNETGLTREQLAALPGPVQQARVEAARRRLAAAGAHYVADAIGDVAAILDDIDARLARGECPCG